MNCTRNQDQVKGLVEKFLNPVEGAVGDATTPGGLPVTPTALALNGVLSFLGEGPEADPACPPAFQAVDVAEPWMSPVGAGGPLGGAGGGPSNFTITETTAEAGVERPPGRVRHGARSAEGEWARIAACGTTSRIDIHATEKGGCGARVEVEETCHSHWCRPCMTRWWLNARSELYRVVADWKWPLEVILTTEDIPLGGLKEGIQKIERSFRRLRQRALWKGSVVDKVQQPPKVSAGIVFRGLTVGKKGWHYHLHLALNCEWMDAETFTKAWKECCAKEGLRAEHTWIARAGGKAGGIMGFIDECLKGTKGDVAHLVEAFRKPEGDKLFNEVLESFYGLPWFRPLGNAIVIRKVKKVCRCPKCGEKYRSAEWEHGVPMPKEENRLMRIKSAVWADFYDGYTIEGGDTVETLQGANEL